jgi:hypothetical protein
MFAPAYMGRKRCFRMLTPFQNRSLWNSCGCAHGQSVRRGYARRFHPKYLICLNTISRPKISACQAVSIMPGRDTPQKNRQRRHLPCGSGLPCSGQHLLFRYQCADTNTKKGTTPPKTSKQTAPKASKQGSIQVDSFGLGTTNTGPAPATSGGGTGKATTGTPNLGSGPKTDPCTPPNPPRSCKQNKPPH